MTTSQRLITLVALVLVLSGCSTFRKIVGSPDPGDPSITIRSAEPRWLLVKNPRYGDVRSEPEYIWVEEDKVPFTIKGVFNKNSSLAPPEIVAQYGSPPGGGKISGRQGVPYQTAAAEPSKADKPARASTASAPAARPAAASGSAVVAAATPAPAAAPEPAKRGYVVYVDTSRIVIDLTSTDGLKTGSLVSLRRDRISIVHPVTGEVLGELDEEIGTARVTETRERFSVAEVQNLAPGSQVQVRDRVVPK
jgi:alkanesulfonate monooxygenase SsuD/methylene tetrahydromethanopterin reductase-like flavin-dependent oxidoreductase (luciferase family)